MLLIADPVVEEERQRLGTRQGEAAQVNQTNSKQFFVYSLAAEALVAEVVNDAFVGVESDWRIADGVTAPVGAPIAQQSVASGGAQTVQSASHNT